MVAQDTAQGEPGRRAVQRGRDVKQAVYDLLQSHEIGAVRRQPPIVNIFGWTSKPDFYIEHAPGFPQGLIIEARAQHTSGTADMKLFGLIETIMRCYPHPTVIVLDGDGWRQQLVQWAREKVDGKKLIGLFTMEEFEAWVARNL